METGVSIAGCVEFFAWWCRYELPDNHPLLDGVCGAIFTQNIVLFFFKLCDVLVRVS
jgi:hypothetical protein